MKVRRPEFNFDRITSRHWLDECAFKTHLCNSFTLMFPAGEKFFIRSVQKYVPKLSDERLKQDVKLFIRQEAQHALEHEKFFSVLREQGHDVDRILFFVESVISALVEKLATPGICLSLTAGFEHLTALLSEVAVNDDFFASADPKLKELFEWHALEELEHRSVAYDVLNASEATYLNRVTGLFGAYLIFCSLSGLITGKLLWNDRELFKSKTIKVAANVFLLDQKLLPKAIAIFLRYLLPNFHPSQFEIEHLKEQIFIRTPGLGIA